MAADGDGAPPRLVIAGSYEGGLHGWTASETDDGDVRLSLRFSFGAHQGCCRCVATNAHVPRAQPLLLSGGDDELVRVYSLKSFRQIGELSRHTGTVTALAFCGSKHAASAAADGAIVLWRLADWACVHVLGGHDAVIPSLSAHSSGRLLLSVGADRTLRLWDLTEGRSAYVTRTKGAATKVVWAPARDAYRRPRRNLVARNPRIRGLATSWPRRRLPGIATSWPRPPRTSHVVAAASAD